MIMTKYKKRHEAWPPGLDTSAFSPHIVISGRDEDVACRISWKVEWWETKTSVCPAQPTPQILIMIMSWPGPGAHNLHLLIRITLATHMYTHLHTHTHSHTFTQVNISMNTCTWPNDRQYAHVYALANTCKLTKTYYSKMDNLRISNTQINGTDMQMGKMGWWFPSGQRAHTQKTSPLLTLVTHNQPPTPTHTVNHVQPPPPPCRYRSHASTLTLRQGGCPAATLDLIGH